MYFLYFFFPYPQFSSFFISSSCRDRCVGGWKLKKSRTSGCIQPPSTLVAFEMLRLLVGNQEFQIFEVSLACESNSG